MTQQEPLHDTALVVADPDAAQLRRDQLEYAIAEAHRAIRQIKQGVEAIADGAVALALTLTDLYARDLYTADADPTMAQSFHRFVEGRLGISYAMAYRYMQGLESFGEVQYRELLTNLGKRRTFALGVLKERAPDLSAAFLDLPVEEQRQISGTALEQLAYAQPKPAPSTADELAAVQAQLDQQRGLYKILSERMKGLESQHLEALGQVITDRDQWEREAHINGKEATKLRNARDKLQKELDKVRAARGQGATGTTATSGSAPSQDAPADGAVQQVVQLVTLDLQRLGQDIAMVTDQVTRLRSVSADVQHDPAYAQVQHEMRRLAQELVHFLGGGL